MSSQESDVIRILLVHQIRLMGQVVAAVLENEPDIEVVDTVESLEGVRACAAESDVVLVSTQLSDDTAMRIVEAIAGSFPTTSVLVLGLAESKEDILRYVEAGADGYVLKDESVDTLLRNVRAAYAGEALVSPNVTATLMARVAELAGQFPEQDKLQDVAKLTPREREVLRLVGRGLSNAEIADELVIEVGTVKNHVHSILQKLQVSSRTDVSNYLAILDEATGE